LRGISRWCLMADLMWRSLVGISVFIFYQSEWSNLIGWGVFQSGPVFSFWIASSPKDLVILSTMYTRIDNILREKLTSRKLYFFKCSCIRSLKS
jgi:hypothetical protein